MTAKKITKLETKTILKPVAGYVLLKNLNDGDTSAEYVTDLHHDDLELVGDNRLHTKEEINAALDEYDGAHQLLVGEVRISHITIRTLKEV